MVGKHIKRALFLRKQKHKTKIKKILTSILGLDVLMSESPIGVSDKQFCHYFKLWERNIHQRLQLDHLAWELPIGVFDVIISKFWWIGLSDTTYIYYSLALFSNSTNQVPGQNCYKTFALLQISLWLRHFYHLTCGIIYLRCMLNTSKAITLF